MFRVLSGLVGVFSVLSGQKSVFCFTFEGFLWELGQCKPLRGVDFKIGILPTKLIVKKAISWLKAEVLMTACQQFLKVSVHSVEVSVHMRT